MRALFMEVVFQTVILLSLVEEDASLLVTVPAGVGVLIQVRSKKSCGSGGGGGGGRRSNALREFCCTMLPLFSVADGSYSL